jgi:hypothetical protein
MKSGLAYKHKSFRDLAFLITKAKDTSLGLEIEFSWVLRGASRDTVISKKEHALIFYKDLINWIPVELGKVLVIDTHYGVENDD